MRALLALALLSGIAHAADRIHLTVTAIVHDSHVTTNTAVIPGRSTSNTSCNGTGMQNGPMATAQVNCQTNTYGSGPQTVETRRLEVQNIVEANGERYTIACTGSWIGTNCSTMIDGDQFQADYDGKTTMWVYARKGGNLGKEITEKYRVLDRRPTPPGEVTAEAILNAIKAAAARHSDFARYQ